MAQQVCACIQTTEDFCTVICESCNVSLNVPPGAKMGTLLECGKCKRQWNLRAIDYHSHPDWAYVTKKCQGDCGYIYFLGFHHAFGRPLDNEMHEMWT